MNLLIDNLPTEVNGEPINTDFRVMVQLETLIYDPEISASEKVGLGLRLLYQSETPRLTLEEAWEGLLWYYRGGEDRDQGQEQKQPQSERQAPRKVRRVYDFTQDAERIYAAFRQVYGVDLQETPLHWWAFRAMLFSLPDSCLQGKIMGYRATDTSKLKGPEKKRIQHLQKLYAITTPGVEDVTSTAERDRKMRDRVLRRFKEAEAWRNRPKESR